MITYKNYGAVTKQYYGQTVDPGGTITVPNYINDPAFIRIFDNPEQESKHIVIFYIVRAYIYRVLGSVLTLIKAPYETVGGQLKIT